MKKVITVIIAVVLVAAAITGYCVWSFNSKYISKKEALLALPLQMRASA